MPQDCQTRRQILRTGGIVVAGGMAGCVGGIGDDDIQDTDGDGVIDSEDYAPRDASVQRAEQVREIQSPPPDTPTETATRTPPDSETRTETPTRTAQLPSFQPFTKTVRTNASFLHVDADDRGIPEPDPIALPERNIAPGKRIVIEALGTFDPSWYGSADNSRCQSIGVFSESATVLDGRRSHRVPGAIDAGDDYRTHPTHKQEEPTDIPEDFLIAGSREDWNDCRKKQVEIRVPSNAEYLFVCVEDNAYGDNQGTLDFEIRPATQ